MSALSPYFESPDQQTPWAPVIFVVEPERLRHETRGEIERGTHISLRILISVFSVGNVQEKT